MHFTFSTGKKSATEAAAAVLEVFPDPFKSMALVTLKMCAFAGTGDVLVVQDFLHICSEHYSADKVRFSLMFYFIQHWYAFSVFLLYVMDLF